VRGQFSVISKILDTRNFNIVKISIHAARVIKFHPHVTEHKQLSMQQEISPTWLLQNVFDDFSDPQLLLVTDEALF
jgi:hypothetical protein